MRPGIASFFLLCALAVDSPAEDAPPEFGKEAHAFLESYCVKCHSGEKAKAELSLDQFRDSDSLIRNRRIWETVQKMVVSGEINARLRATTLRPPAASKPSVTRSSR